ncbi:MAG TPA: hypothetical protein VF431_05025, partial [Candidatus Methylomirabilis sp.]
IKHARIVRRIHFQLIELHHWDTSVCVKEAHFGKIVGRKIAWWPYRNSKTGFNPAAGGTR